MKWRLFHQQIKALALGCLCFVVLAGGFSLDVNATELSGGTTIPAGGVVNSLYLAGSPVPGVTIKLKTDEDWEYTAFIGSAVLASFEKITKLGGSVYTIFGGTVPLALNVGGGIYLREPDPIGVRLQYVSLITGGGSIMGSGLGGPYPIGWLGLLVSWKL